MSEHPDKAVNTFSIREMRIHPQDDLVRHIDLPRLKWRRIAVEPTTEPGATTRLPGSPRAG